MRTFADFVIAAVSFAVVILVVPEATWQGLLVAALAPCRTERVKQKREVGHLYRTCVQDMRIGHVCRKCVQDLYVGHVCTTCMQDM